MRFGIDKMKCDICGSTNNVERQPTRSQLIFGGFRGKMTELRCDECEKKLVKRIEGLLNVTIRPNQVAVGSQ